MVIQIVLYTHLNTVMNQQDRVSSQFEIESYLAEKNVYEHLQQLLRGIIIDRPSNTIDYLIAKLEEPEQKQIFVVGPPGFRLQELALSIADSRGDSNQKLSTFSIGDQINKEYSKKGALAGKIEEAMRRLTYVSDEVVNEIMGIDLQKYKQEKRSYIIQGFPKTLTQALFLQRSNIHPTSLIIVNMDENKMVEYCYHKVQSLELLSDLTEEEKWKLARQHQKEYMINIEKVKQVYNGSYFEINAGTGENVQKLLEEADRILALKGKTKALKKPIQILIHGYPSTVRTPLGKEIAEKYGLVFVSSPNLIANEVIRASPDGLMMKQSFEMKELVNEATILKLVKARITQKDCQLRGFVLEGFPKTETQLQYLQFMGIKPTLFILLDDTRSPRPPVPAHNESPESEVRSRNFNSFIEGNYSGGLLKLNSGDSLTRIFEEICYFIERS